MDLLRIARVPPVTIRPHASVREAVMTMSDAGAGAVVITDEERRAIGIFTASDLLRRVVVRAKGLESTRLDEVMTSPLTVAQKHTAPEDALSLMVENHVRHLPIVDEAGRVCGMLSTRHLLRDMLADLSHELQALDAYYAADGIGG